MRRRFGTIKKRGDCYLCRWTDVYGNRRSETIRGTEADAEMFLAKIEMGMLGADSGSTYGEYWDAIVMPQIAKLADKTRSEYIRLWKRELEPVLSKRLISSTNYRFAQSVIDGIESPTVQRSTARLWSKICNMAVRDGILPANPVQRMTYKKHEKRRKAILNAEDVIRYTERFLTTKYAHLIVLEMCAGLRHEEACALTAEDVSVVGGVAYVNVNKARIAINGKVIDKDTKNAYSVRRLPVCGVCADMLSECDIQPINPQTASHNLRAWCARHDVEYIPFGQMRSNFATHAGEVCDGALVDIYMGHNGKTTMDTWYRQSTESGLLKVAIEYEKHVYSPLKEQVRDNLIMFPQVV